MIRGHTVVTVWAVNVSLALNATMLSAALAIGVSDAICVGIAFYADIPVVVGAVLTPLFARRGAIGDACLRRLVELEALVAAGKYHAAEQERSDCFHGAPSSWWASARANP